VPGKRGYRTSEILVRHLSGNPTNRDLARLNQELFSKLYNWGQYFLQESPIDVVMNLRPSGGVSRGFLPRTGMFFGRAFFPLFAIAIIVGTALWGPWVSLGVTVIAIAAALRLL
jgi:hypothetical protein